VIVVLHSRLELRAVSNLLSAGYLISTVSTRRHVFNVAHREPYRSNVVALRASQSHPLTHS
jgi:hypothetical protein